MPRVPSFHPCHPGPPAAVHRNLLNKTRSGILHKMYKYSFSAAFVFQAQFVNCGPDLCSWLSFGFRSKRRLSFDSRWDISPGLVWRVLRPRSQVDIMCINLPHGSWETAGAACQEARRLGRFYGAGKCQIYAYECLWQIQKGLRYYEPTSLSSEAYSLHLRRTCSSPIPSQTASMPHSHCHSHSPSNNSQFRFDSTFEHPPKVNWGRNEN